MCIWGSMYVTSSLYFVQILLASCKTASAQPVDSSMRRPQRKISSALLESTDISEKKQHVEHDKYKLSSQQGVELISQSQYLQIGKCCLTIGPRG